MWMKGSSRRRSTPANARRTGKPSPSNPVGAVVTLTTGRSRSTAGSVVGVRGNVRVSAVTAGMASSWVVTHQKYLTRQQLARVGVFLGDERPHAVMVYIHRYGEIAMKVCHDRR